jgi:RNA methyltransferase, TrmH family
MPTNYNLKISSRDNPKIKHARLIREGRVKEQIFVEGLRLCEEAFRANLKISEVFVSENFAQNERHENFLKEAEPFNLIEVSEKIFDSLSDTKTSQGVILIAEKPAHGKNIIEARLNDSEFPLVVLLHRINNPANLGAILRTAEASGVSGIITTKNSTDVFSPKALRGAMGAGFRLPLWTNVNYFEALEWAGERSLKSVCADVRSAKSYTEIDWKIGRLLVIGSEGHGLSETERDATEESLIIPMENGVESLNAAVACGVILFEAKRQKTVSMENGKRKTED